MPINAKKKTRQGSMLNKQLRRQNKYSDGWMISTQKMARRDAGLSLCAIAWFVCVFYGWFSRPLQSEIQQQQRQAKPGAWIFNSNISNNITKKLSLDR